jgi:hypothetical protein
MHFELDNHLEIERLVKVFCQKSQRRSAAPPPGKVQKKFFGALTHNRASGKFYLGPNTKNIFGKFYLGPNTQS